MTSQLKASDQWKILSYKTIIHMHTHIHRHTQSSQTHTDIHTCVGTQTRRHKYTRFYLMKRSYQHVHYAYPVEKVLRQPLRKRDGSVITTSSPAQMIWIGSSYTYGSLGWKWSSFKPWEEGWGTLEQRCAHAFTSQGAASHIQRHEVVWEPHVRPTSDSSARRTWV